MSAAFHFFEDIGLIVAIGSITVRRLGRMPPRLAWVEPPMSASLAVAAAGGAGVLAVEHSWLIAVRVAAEAAAWLLCVRGIRFVAPVVVLAVALLPLTGHAARLSFGGQFADALHVLSAGMWGGGVVALATLRPPEGWKSPEAILLLDRFGRVAVLAFAVTALTGVLRATEQLSAVSDLWTTTYGIVLALKGLAVVLMLVLGVMWRRSGIVRVLDPIVVIAVIAATGLLAAIPVSAR